jgi:CspA family cold shock protein
MLTLDQIESGVQCIHKNTKLRYSVVEVGDDEVLLSPESAGMQDLVVPTPLFCTEFVLGDRYSERGRGKGGPRRGSKRPGGVSVAPTGPRSKGRIKKMVRDRGFGFIRGEDGKEVFFHRSGLNGADYDALSEGDAVEYVIQEGPRGARAEHVRSVGTEAATAS